MKAKSIWQSWTMWFNGVMATVVLMIPLLYAELPTLKAYVPDSIYKWVLLTVIVANIYLRTRTNRPVKMK